MKIIQWIKIEIDEDLPSILKGLKEAGRVVLLSVVPVLITQLENDSFDFKVLWIVGGLAFLKFIDKTLHEKGKVDENESLKLGLTRF